jgi:thiol-disulfide isomerase/thioredoxin
MATALGRFGRGLLIGSLVLGAAVVATPRDATAQSARQGRPWLGLSMEDLRPDSVRVRHVVRTSPAEKAGVRGGDLVLKVDNVRVSTANDVIRLVGAHAIGDIVPLTISRDAKELSVRVTLGSFPSSDDMIRMDFVGQFAPAWKGVEAVAGAVPPNVSALRGKVLVLSFWATWCGACRMLSPRLSDWQQRLGAQGLVVIGLSSEDAADVATFVPRMNMRYSIGVDKKGETSAAYHVSSLPSVFIVDKRGVVRDVAVGYDPTREAQLEALLRTLLAEPPPAD